MVNPRSRFTFSKMELSQSGPKSESLALGYTPRTLAAPGHPNTVEGSDIPWCLAVPLFKCGCCLLV